MRSLHLLACLCLLLLAGCTARQMPGFQDTFVSHTVRDDQLAEITRQFQRRKLAGAAVTRDLVGRVRLTGAYQDEDEVDSAFLIVQGVVGQQATSPFYPDDVRQTRWSVEMAKALAEAARPRPPRPPRKMALIIGVSHFKHADQITPVMGEEDAVTAAHILGGYGYEVTSLIGKDATREAIAAALRNLKAQAGPQDQLFIFISSHGTPPIPLRDGLPDGSKDYKMSIVAYDTQARYKNLLDQPSAFTTQEQADAYHDARQLLFDTSVPDFLLREVLARPTAGTRLVLDVCYGGNVLIGTPDPYAGQRAGDGSTGETTSIPADGLMQSPAAGDGMQAKGIRQVGGAPPAANPSSPASTLLDDKAPPRTIITAADAGQQSFGPLAVEKGRFEHPSIPNLTLEGSFFAQMFFDELSRQNGALRPSFANSQKATLLLHEQRQRRRNKPVTIRQNPQLRSNEPDNLNLTK